MNDLPDNEMNDVIRRALRRELTEAEKQELELRLNRDAAFREAFELEQNLEQLLERLPHVPVSTNFTSLVLQSVRSETKQSANSERRWWRAPFPFARLAAGMAVVTVAGFLSVNQYRKTEQREMVRSVTSFTEVASAIGSEESPNLVFQDFEAISRYSIPADSELDMELLVALQK